MSSELTSESCHGEEDTGEKDLEKAKLPTIKTCQECHEEQAGQYLPGMHALGLVSMKEVPYTHIQLQTFIAGQKGCGGCHTLGLVDERKRQTESRRYYRYGMDCQSYHTRHAFSKTEDSEPEACRTCHMGFDHAQWEMWSGCKHGVAYLVNRSADPENKDLAPTYQNCHMNGGDHREFCRACPDRYFFFPDV